MVKFEYSFPSIIYFPHRKINSNFMVAEEGRKKNSIFINIGRKTQSAQISCLAELVLMIIAFPSPIAQSRAAKLYVDEGF